MEEKGSLWEERWKGGGLSGRVRGISSAVIGYELLAKVCFSVSGPVFDLIFVSLCAKEEGAGIRDSGGGEE